MALHKLVSSGNTIPIDLYKIKLPDAIIAATALVHNLTLLTRNEKDFSKISNVEITNPWNK